MTLDDVSFTAKTATYSGGNAIGLHRCAAFFDTDSPQNFIRRDVLDRMLSVGTAWSACERPSNTRYWGGFGASAPLRASTRIRLSVHFFRESEPACPLAVWACVAPPLVVQHAVLLGRDSWMRFNTRSYRALSPRSHDNRFLGELTLSHHATTGVSANAIDPADTNSDFRLLYDGTVGATLSDEPQLLDELSHGRGAAEIS